jgi:hypothetical protein
MIGTSGKEKQQSPQKCPKCSNTENLTVAVTVVPDGSSVLGGRVVWDNDSAAECGACGFIGKVADFEPKDSYGPPDAAAGGAARSFRLTMPAKPIFLAARLTCFCLGVEFLNGVRQASISDRHGCACSFGEVASSDGCFHVS